jgi:hypothetical protein
MERKGAKSNLLFLHNFFVISINNPKIIPINDEINIEKSHFSKPRCKTIRKVNFTSPIPNPPFEKNQMNKKNADEISGMIKTFKIVPSKKINFKMEKITMAGNISTSWIFIVRISIMEIINNKSKNIILKTVNTFIFKVYRDNVSPAFISIIV